ncbi:MAG: hypothetical protein ABR907_03035 [Terracidiphilus sp.]|jgi:hypothetical protein
MQLKIKFAGAQAHEQTPSVALYTLDIRGQAKKLAALKDGELNLKADSAKAGSLIALGPDVADPSTLDPKLLVTYKAATQLPLWEKTPIIEIAAQFWRPWLPIRVCLAGTVSKCYPWVIDKISLLRSIALGNSPSIHPIERCVPICNGVVEVWESTCCCFPFLIEDVPVLISKIQEVLAQNPLMFPPPPRQEATASRALKASVDKAIAAGKADLRYLPSAQLSQDLQVLQSSSAADAATYFQNHPYLWPIWCHCSTAKLAETPLNADGSFQYCYNQYLYPWPFCSHSFFYKVKQFVGGSWVYIYDGSAAHQYFSADEVANLSTLLGNACGGVQPPPGTDFVNLQQIGSTLSYALHSNWDVDTATNTDHTQTGPYSVQTPPSYGGLVNANNAPWCKTLSFMLYFDPGMEALGAYYYRMSIAPADLNGNPVGAMQPIQNSIAWLKYVEVVVNGQTQIDVLPQTLGPNTVGSLNGLFQIPYNADADWLSGQAHQYYDTTTLNAAAAGIPGPRNGRFLLAVEIFDSAGNRLVPPGVTPGPGDTAASFQYLRMTAPPGPNSTANVPYAALTHLFWADNRPVHGEIDNFSLNGVTSNAQCQFLSGAASDSFQVGFRAYHAVLGDDGPTPPTPPSPNPLPPTSFMESYSLTWERGLNGPSGTFDSGGDIDVGSPLIPAPPQPPQQSPAANGLLSNLLGPPPTPPPTACSFAIDLYVTSKHTDGSSHFDDLDFEVLAAVALSIV